MKIKKVKKAIRQWDEKRSNPEKVVKYLKSGVCFKLEKSVYEKWKQNDPKYFHVYMGIEGKELKIIMIDSISDKDPENFSDFIFVQDYLPGLDILEEGFIAGERAGDISPQKALERNFRWNLFMKSWVYNKVKTTDGVFQAFRFPFKDLHGQFDNASNTESIVAFGLTQKNVPDLIIWGTDNVLRNRSTDVEEESVSVKTGSMNVNGDEDGETDDISCPVPPFGDGEYGLLG